MVTSEEFASWKASRVTKWVMEAIKLEREKLKEELAVLSLSDSGALAVKHAEYVGMCTALFEMLNLSYQNVSDVYKLDSEKENEDGEPVGNNPA